MAVAVHHIQEFVHGDGAGPVSAGVFQQAAKFKDPDDPLRIVFVTAMWITGFDVPSLSTIYLDKPLRDHTLMQAIARANRVFAGKLNGLIVDYVGIFRDLQRALALYAS